eukprot:CAMPEP_0168616574 /NCGR_PEP_ID=MMETSP0449_2-20121227/5096_1 /TAXON_ID=1082188 /ORGANISM="Strombidium rassoulzadegani, Strain ras09" /LENGTH=278 /DNA_ID=CAMNT_0008657361 /DNA_START=240 /DNA_END=1076 /DNA_ORIENTATION=+
MPHEAGAVAQVLVVAAKAEVPLLAPVLGPGVPQQPVLAAPALPHILVGDGGVDSEADEGNGVVGPALVEQSQAALPVIDDAAYVVLDAGVDLHGDGDDALASQLLQVSCLQVVVGLEPIDLEHGLGLGASLVPAGPSLVLVLVALRGGEALVLSVVEGEDLLSSDTAEVGDHVAVDQLLFREGGNLVGLVNGVVASIEILDGSHGRMCPARPTLLLILKLFQDHTLFNPVGGWTVENGVEEIVVADLHAHGFRVALRLNVPSLLSLLPREVLVPPHLN